MLLRQTTTRAFVAGSVLPRSCTSLPHRTYFTSRNCSRPGRAVLVQSSMLENLKQAISKVTTVGADEVQYLAFSDSAPSWDVLKEMIEAKRQELGVQEPDLEAGPTSAASLRRTFGKAGEPQIKLYRDHAAWCPYCQKVWLQLEEKQVPYVIEKINMRCYGDKPADFMRKVPSGLLPVMEYKGRVITESAVIARILEHDFPEKPLLPAEGTPERQRAEDLMKLERRLFSAWLGWLCQSWGDAQNKAAFNFVMNEVEAQLGAAGGPFFLGKDFSLVDITFVPFVERLVASLQYYKGYVVRGQGRYPNLERWFEALEQRPSYLGTKSDFYTHCHDLPPQLGGCYSTAAGEPFAAAIDGKDGKTWHLPLPPLNAQSPEPYAPGEDPERDCLAAATKLVSNHAAVTRFALRGAGCPGIRPVSAPLADPTASYAEEYLQDADAALRHVAHALLVGVDAKQLTEHPLKTADKESPATQPVVVSLAYLRDRVGVPRDLPFPAARQLRAHLNWFIDSVCTA